jgi:hypothetical protein
MENRDAAYILFTESWDQKRIAQALGVTEKTVGNWKKAGECERKRTEQALARETSEAILWELIQYQLTALKRKKDEWIGNDEFRLLDKGDIDALAKMYSSVKAKQHTWAQIVDLATEITEFIEQKNFQLAKEIIPLVDEFLMTKKGNL